ncbi:MAG: hypothetical protein AAF975_08350, partial [Spirochaetota bacterium]
MNEVKILKPQGNEIIALSDEEAQSKVALELLNNYIPAVVGETQADIIVRGFQVTEVNPPGMEVKITAGFAIYKDSGTLYSEKDITIAIADGNATERRDGVYIQPVFTDSDIEGRRFIDRTQKLETNKNVPTRRIIGIKASVLQGGATAPDTPDAWLKLAEVRVTVNNTQNIPNSVIFPVTATLDRENNANWLKDGVGTFRLETLNESKNRFRAKHKEDGDFKDDIIQHKDINWGTDKSAGQVGASNIPLDVDVTLGSTVPTLAQFNATQIQQISQLCTNMPMILGSISEFWVDGADYKREQQRIYNGKLYICTSDHRATAANAPGQAGSPWEAAPAIKWEVGRTAIQGSILSANDYPFFVKNTHVM